MGSASKSTSKGVGKGVTKGMDKGVLPYDFAVAMILFTSVYAAIFISLPSISAVSKKFQDPFYSNAFHLSESFISNKGSGLISVRRNIFEIDKAVALNNSLCTDIKTDITKNFKLSIETSTVTYGCNATVPATARLVERSIYIKDGLSYTPAKLRVWVW
jgi:hypothetical protein